MSLVAISLRYSRALFDLAKEKNLLDEVYKDLELIKTSLKPVKEFQDFIASPIIKNEKKREVFTAIFKDVVNPLSLNFLVFLVNKNRENLIFDIIRNYEKKYREEKNIKEVFVSTPFKINSEIEQKLSNIVKKFFNASAEINNIVDDSMIGGVKVRIDNLLLDMSIKTQLQEIKKTLKTEVYKYKA